MSAKPFYSLLQNAWSTGNQVDQIAGGDYLWRCEAANWNGATATLQYRKLDGSTWATVLDGSAQPVTLTADGQVSIGVAQNAVMRVAISVAVPTGMNSTLGGI